MASYSEIFIQLIWSGATGSLRFKSSPDDFHEQLRRNHWIRGMMWLFLPQFKVPLIYFFPCMYLFFGHSMQLFDVGCQFPGQGMNLGHSGESAES